MREHVGRERKRRRAHKTNSVEGCTWLSQVAADGWFENLGVRNKRGGEDPF